MGRQGLQALHQLIGGGSADSVRLAPELVVRASS
jgi:DNA-binding LacI/PurR family transcriptional regulator